MRLTALATIDLTDPNSQQKQLELFESLRDDPQALQEACVQLCQDGAHTKPQTCFFLLLIVEHNLKKRGEPWPGIKESLQRFAQTGSDQPPFLANKTAQVLALAFVDLYPAKWPDFFQSLIQSGPDIFLRTLSQIDGEVVNRQINHSKSDLDRNTKLKDEMREKDVVQLVDAWMGILDGVKSGSISNDIGEVCLEVVGQYVEWIDINLIVNDNFMAYLFFLLKRDELTDSVCECMCEIVQKGMPPKEKCLLVESLYNALNETGLFQVESEDHFEAVAKLVSALGSELVFQNEKLAKDENPELIKIGKDAMLAAEAKLQLAIKFLRNDDNDVAMETIQFIQQYLDRIRHSGQQISSDILHAIMDATVTKFRYPDNYNFDSNGLDEAECDEFMNDLKQLFESICLVQPLVAIQMVTSRVNQLNDQMSHLDAECTIRMLYNLGECLPTEMGPISFKADNKSELQNLVGVFVQKSVPTHHAVVRLSLETLVRYDKYFMFDKSYLGPVIKFMVGQGGLMHQHGTVRSRAAYLFSRFVREMTPALSQYASELLQTLQNCLYQGGEDFLSESDRSFVFEAAGYLVNVSPLSPEEKHQLYASMIAPLVKRFQDDLELLSKETDPEIQSAIATRASQYVSWCGRTTKCWKGPETVQSCQAGPILAECVRVFMNALDLPHTVNDRSLILQSIRTFLHRMLICLSSDILVLLPSALSSFLRGVQYKDLHDLFPLINQIASKFKNGAFDVLSQGLLELFQATFPLMCTGETEEDKIMKRDFFGFLNTICNCQLTGILISPQNQGQLGDVIKQLHSGATGSDPVAAKLCFMVFTKLSKEWVNQFTEFGMVVKDTIIPSCFLGPSSPHFDLKDAQCQMAIVESANCMKELFNLSGEGLVIYLRDEYMRQSLQCNNEIIDEYLQALTSKDIKAFRSYTKVFFGRTARV